MNTLFCSDVCCPANIAHVRQSMPDFGLGVEVKAPLKVLSFGGEHLYFKRLSLFASKRLVRSSRSVTVLANHTSNSILSQLSPKVDARQLPPVARLQFARSVSGRDCLDVHQDSLPYQPPSPLYPPYPPYPPLSGASPFPEAPRKRQRRVQVPTRVCATLEEPLHSASHTLQPAPFVPHPTL